MSLLLRFTKQRLYELSFLEKERYLFVLLKANSWIASDTSPDQHGFTDIFTFRNLFRVVIMFFSETIAHSQPAVVSAPIILIVFTKVII